jgi:hypothetical protein
MVPFARSPVKHHGALLKLWRLSGFRYHCILGELPLCWRYAWSGLHLSYALQRFPVHILFSPNLVSSSTHGVTAGSVLVKIMRRFVKVKTLSGFYTRVSWVRTWGVSVGCWRYACTRWRCPGQAIYQMHQIELCVYHATCKCVRVRLAVGLLGIDGRRPG